MENVVNVSGEGNTVEWTKMPLGPIKFEIDDQYWEYRPLADVTTHELAFLIQLFVAASVAVNSRAFITYDFKDFILKHGVERHFAKLPQD